MKASRAWAVVSLALIATAVLAASAIASELPGLQQEGKPLPVGRKLELKNVGPVTITNARFGNVSCSTVVLSGPVARNEASAKFPFFKAEFEEYPSKMEGCVRTRKGESPQPFIVFGVWSPAFETTGPTSAETGEAPAGMWLIFHWHTMSTNPGATQDCEIASKNLSWSFKPGTSSLTLNPSPMTVEKLACGPAWTISGKFSASSGGKPVIVN